MEPGLHNCINNFLYYKNAKAQARHTISRPVTQTSSGELCFFIKSLKGESAAALLQYADGCAPGNKITVSESALLGNTIADLHNITQAFKPLCD